MPDYDPADIEPSWQTRWEEAGAFRTDDEGERPPYYCLEMLPYPSGRIHMGHVRNYSIGDAVARFRRMRGHRVLRVTGWDAFGLPAENAAIERGAAPRRWTDGNIAAMKAQLRRLGFCYDWNREIATCDPEYYRWNQWFFLRMLDRGLAYRARRFLNWCDSCGTTLANEQVVGGLCWRCDSPVVRREFEQWFLAITRYAQELLDDLDRLPDWPDRVVAMQRNWIGRSEGASVRFGIEGRGEETIEVFTTRIDTIYGATYLAVAVEHPLAEAIAVGTAQEGPVRAFLEDQKGKSVEDRFAEGVEKIGVFAGRHAVNPFSGARIPIWIANFVLTDVGTGAIMSVPAHDERDFAFARKYGLPVRPVVRPGEGQPLAAGSMEEAFGDDGVLHDSGPYDGVASAEARARMVEEAARRGIGSATTTYRLRDWGISRQRYWGTPIPVVHCDSCGPVGVPEQDLPVVLPDEAPLTGSGGSPLARVDSFVRTACPRCGGEGRRETDTMDTFVDSSWYYFRYADPRNDAAPFDWSRAAPWFPVDLYIGGIEHATMHLIYTRFWTKMMRDIGVVSVGEPVARLFTQGMVIKDGAKMSKSKGNVVDPDRMVDRYGADTTRLFSLFAAPPEKDLEWSEDGVEGCWRFLSRVWRTFERVRDRLPAPGGTAEGTSPLRRRCHRTIARVTEDLGPRMHFNTAIAAIMELVNEASPLADSEEAATLAALRETFETLAKLLSPMAPHFAEELWAALGGEGFVMDQAWPDADPALLVDDEVTFVVQVNGKVRGKLTLPRGAGEENALAAARREPNVLTHIEGKTVRRVIHVPDRLLNLVVS